MGLLIRDVPLNNISELKIEISNLKIKTRKIVTKDGCKQREIIGISGWLDIGLAVDYAKSVDKPRVYLLIEADASISVYTLSVGGGVWEIKIGDRFNETRWIKIKEHFTNMRAELDKMKQRYNDASSWNGDETFTF